jgi:hypothetical protein
VEANIDFLAMILGVIDLTVQTHLQSCLVYEDPADIDVACLNFCTAQTVVLNYTIFVNLPDFLRDTAKRPWEETVYRSIMSDIMSGSAGTSKASRKDVRP